MKNYFFYLIIVIAVLSVSGNTNANKSLISKIQEKYSSGSTIRAEFEMKTWWNVREREDLKAGTISVAAGDKFRVALGNDLLVSNGTTYYQYNSASKQVQVKNLKDIDLSMHPSQVLTSFLTQYPLKETGRSGNMVTLSWKADSTTVTGGYLSVEVTVDTKGNIKVLKNTDKNLNVFTYTFTKTEFGGNVQKGVFEFEIPKDMQVIDER